MSSTDTTDDQAYAGWAILVSAAVSIVVTALLVWWASGFGAFYETVFRINPTIEGGGVGADWVAGNTIPALDFLIALVHAADVILGLFVLFLVFVHWSAFRRFAGMMTEHSSSRKATTDGGPVDDGGGGS